MDIILMRTWCPVEDCVVFYLRSDDKLKLGAGQIVCASNFVCLIIFRENRLFSIETISSTIKNSLPKKQSFLTLFYTGADFVLFASLSLRLNINNAIRYILALGKYLAFQVL